MAKDKIKAEPKISALPTKKETEIKTDPAPAKSGETVKPISFTETGVNAQIFAPRLKRGEVLVVSVDKNGAELNGSGFVTSLFTAEKYYGDPAKFIIKKKV